MANLTQPTKENVDDFLATVEDPKRRADAATLVELMTRVTGERPRMWGASMIGFGQHHYRYDSGREGDWFTVGLSPRKGALTIYGIHDGYREADPLLEQLGPHTLGKGCVYVKSLSALDAGVLGQLVRQAWQRPRT